MDSSEDKNCSALQNVNDVFSSCSLHLASGNTLYQCSKIKNRRLLFFAGLQSKRVAASKNMFSTEEGLPKVPVPVDGPCLIHAWHVLSNDRPSELVSLVVESIAR